MRVLYISYDGMSDPLGQSQVIPYLADLNNYGIEFHILSAEKSGDLKKDQELTETLLSKHNIKWHYISYTKRPQVLSTISDTRKLIKKAKQLQNKYKFDICHCRSYIASFAGIELKKNFGVPFLFDMRGFFADERVDGGLWNLKNPVYKVIYRYFKNKEKQFLSHADHTISLTEAGKEILCSKNFNSDKDDVTVIPCCADLNHFDPRNTDSEQINIIRKDTGINENDFVISYLGSLGTWYMTDEMLDFYKELLKSKPEAKFFLISRDKPEIILNSAKEKNIPLRNIIVRSASRKEVPAMISLSSISIFFIKPVFSKKASSPTKLAELLGMGIPVICNSNVGDIDRIVEKHKAGIVIENMKQESYKSAISGIDKLLKKAPEELRNISTELFSLKRGSSSYFNVYNKIKK